MKINSNPIRGAALVALLTGVSPLVSAQMDNDTPSPYRSDSPSQSASKSESMQGEHQQQKLTRGSANELTGMNVHNRNGESIGEIKDFVIDAKSGQVVYAVVGSGGVLGIGETLHAVPVSALKYESIESGESLTLDIDSARWAQAPRFKKDRLSSLQADQEGKSTFEYYGQTWQPSGPSLSMQREPIQKEDALPSAQQESQLVMSSKLIGKNIRSGTQEVGEVEDILLQLENSTASLLLDPNDDFTGTDQKFIIPFSKVMLQGEDTLTTAISREDFSSAQVVQGDSWSQSGRDGNLFIYPGAAAAGAVERAGQGIARTGERAGEGIERAGDRVAESADRTGDRVAGKMDRAAQPQGQPPVAEIRRALQSDTSIAQQAGRNVQVIAEGDKVVLLGTVQSELAKNQIEQRVQQTAPGWNVQNQIRVATADE